MGPDRYREIEREEGEMERLRYGKFERDFERCKERERD